MATYTQQLQRIVRAYLDDSQPWPATTRQIAAWAIRRGRWQPQPFALINQCADQLARAMREEHITDDNGRIIRAKHVARIEQSGEQTALWADIRSASCEHMQIAFQQRRQQIVGDCRQLKADCDYYNRSRSPGEPIQIVFDFRTDLEELEQDNAAA